MTELKNWLKLFWENNKHFTWLLYLVGYTVWFAYLEQTVTTHFHVIHMTIDDYIPFCEYFIVPYLLWFFYVAFGILFTGFTDKKEYYRLCTFLFTGMTVFLLVSTLFPNGHLLRPATFENPNFFTDLCAALWRTDTSTNIFPSIHVYNSIGVHLAVLHGEKTKNHKVVRLLSGILMVSIILSTVFLKQHSMFDVITAFMLAFIMYVLVYAVKWKRVRAFVRVKQVQRKKAKIKQSN